MVLHILQLTLLDNTIIAVVLVMMLVLNLGLNIQFRNTMKDMTQSAEFLGCLDCFAGCLERRYKVSETFQIGQVCGSDCVAEEDHEGGEGTVDEDPIKHVSRFLGVKGGYLP